MPKQLPPQTLDALSPPAGLTFPYTFFERAAQFPFQASDSRLNLRTAWWLADAAFLAYSSNEVVTQACVQAGLRAVVKPFVGVSTQAFVISTQDWMLISFRGTQLDRFWDVLRDWAVNIRFVPVPDGHGNSIHAGFREALDEVWSGLASYVRDRQREQRRPLWITGHSLGGALAIAAASRCALDAALGLTGVYTFGAPRVGNSGFVSSISAPVYRFRHNMDAIARIPFGFSYAHAGELQFIDATGGFQGGNRSWWEHLLDLRIAATAAWGRWPAGGVTLPRPIADHAPINYSILLWNILEGKS